MEDDNSTVTTAPIAKKRSCCFQVGDHVFAWCSYLGVPFSYQEHGIVVDAPVNEESENDDAFVVILNFDHKDDDEGDFQGQETYDGD